MNLERENSATPIAWAVIAACLRNGRPDISVDVFDNKEEANEQIAIERQYDACSKHARIWKKRMVTLYVRTDSDKKKLNEILAEVQELKENERRKPKAPHLSES